jgi:hypothetical protein
MMYQSNQVICIVDSYQSVYSVTDFIQHVKSIHDRWRIHGLEVQRSHDPAVFPWFRGVSDRTYPLVPSLMYMCKEGEEFDEFWLNVHFKNRAHLLHDREIRHSLDSLILLRHYGGPSRIMDWTESALTALYFAVSDKDRMDADGVVYLLQPFLWNYAVSDTQFYAVPESHDDRMSRYTSLPFEQDRKHHAICSEDHLGRFALAIRPPMSNTRILAQRGNFTIHGKDIGFPKAMAGIHVQPDMVDQSLELRKKINDCRKTDLLDGIRISAKGKLTIRKELAMMGIAHSTLFPDLEGLAKELSFQYLKSSIP